MVIVDVCGKLVKEDFELFVPEFERLVALHARRGRLRVLFDMTDFHGWTVGAMWEDTKFGFYHSNDVERIAMVGEEKWQHGLALFCKPFTNAVVKFFEHCDTAKAIEWLTKD